MNDLKNFRLINNFEKEIIINTLSQISSEFISLLNDKMYNLYIIINPRKFKGTQLSIYLIQHNQKYLPRITSSISNIYSLGLYFGFIEKGSFLLSLEGAEFLYRNKYISEKNLIVVNTEGEKSILYGNNILKKMVSVYSNELKKNDLILVLNELTEILALGITKIDGNDFKKLINPLV